MAVYRLDENLWFPDPHGGEEDGLVAVGGDLSVDRLLLAYYYGFFPWYSYKLSEPHWYCPLDRYVIFPKEIHISHSMRQLVRQDKYVVTVNRDFEGVIRGCATVNGRDHEFGAWLGPNIIKAYTELHRLGYATSVEVWEPQTPTPDYAACQPQDSDSVDKNLRLVGGLYSVTIRDAFFGESMFSLVPNASKLALIRLAEALGSAGGLFIDCQFETPLFKSMGGRHISYDEYINILDSHFVT